MLVKDFMTTDVETVAPTDEISEVLTRLARADFGGFPVVDDSGAIVGIVTEHDLVELFQPRDRTLWIPIGFPPFLESVTYGIDIAWDELEVGVDLFKNANRPISDIMTASVVTIAPTDPIDRAIELLGDSTRDINRLPVVDETQLVGIVTRQDVLQVLANESSRGES